MEVVPHANTLYDAMEQIKMLVRGMDKKRLRYEDLIACNYSGFVRALDTHNHRHTRKSGYPLGWGVLVSSTLNSYDRVRVD